MADGCTRGDSSQLSNKVEVYRSLNNCDGLVNRVYTNVITIGLF